MITVASNREQIRSCRHRLPVWAALGACAIAGHAMGQALSTGFESPTFDSSPEGVSVNGQDSWFTPAVAGSVDGRVFDYLGNTLGLPVHIQGGDQFLGGVSAGGSALMRAQREGIEFPMVAVISYDILGAYSGGIPAQQNLGSFSLQRTRTPPRRRSGRTSS